MDVKVTTKELRCPKCGRPEVRPDGKLNIRGFKVFDEGRWWSKCLPCGLWF
jgi:hypothetical protein